MSEETEKTVLEELEEEAARWQEAFPHLRFDHMYYPNAGWPRLVWKLCERLERFAEKYDVLIHIMQVKEKFGTLRFYTGEITELDGSELSEDREDTRLIYERKCDIIEEIETASGYLCEKCESYAKRCRPNGFWIRTLCESCEGEAISN